MTSASASVRSVIRRPISLARKAWRRVADPRLDIDLNESQWWSQKQFRIYQERHLPRVLRRAERLPAYREKFAAAHIQAARIRSIDDLSLLPLTTRTEMQGRPSFVDRSKVRATLYTGGSTGEPLEYYECTRSVLMRAAAHARGWSWNGYVPGKRLAVITSAQGTVGGPGTLNLNGDLSAESLRDAVCALHEFKPHHLRGYVGSLFVLAQYLKSHGQKIRGLESINPISENLYDYQRAVMEEVFDCPVFEEYCCNDGGACAWECEAHQGLHLFVERAIVECVEGEVVTTELHNFAMPFIRYVNGDRIEFLDDECRCGRKLPLVRVRGRSNDVILAPDRPVSATYLMYHGVEYSSKHFRSGIHAVQYVQTPGYRMTANVVRNPWFSDQDAERFEKKLCEILPGMKIELRYVDALEMTPAGKLQFVINRDTDLLSRWEEGKLEYA